MNRGDLVLHYKRWRVEEYHAVVSGLGPGDLESFLPRLMGTLFLEALVCGACCACVRERV